MLNKSFDGIFGKIYLPHTRLVMSAFFLTCAMLNPYSFAIVCAMGFLALSLVCD